MTITLHYGISHNASDPCEGMSIVGILKRDRKGRILGVKAICHRQLNEYERRRASAERLNIHHEFQFVPKEEMQHLEWVVISLIRGLRKDSRTVLMADMQGNVVGNNDGAGMNVWGQELHINAMNAFMRKTMFIDMERAYNNTRRFETDTPPIQQKREVKFSYKKNKRKIYSH